MKTKALISYKYAVTAQLICVYAKQTVFFHGAVHMILNKIKQLRTRADQKAKTRALQDVQKSRGQTMIRSGKPEPICIKDTKFGSRIRNEHKLMMTA